MCIRDSLIALEVRRHVDHQRILILDDAVDVYKRQGILIPAAGDGNAAFGKIDVCEGIVGIRERQAVVCLLYTSQTQSR